MLNQPCSALNKDKEKQWGENKKVNQKNVRESKNIVEKELYIYIYIPHVSLFL